MSRGCSHPREFRKIAVSPYISGEHLVAAIAGQHYLDVLAGKPREEKEGKGGGNCKGFVCMPCDLRQPLDQVWGQVELLMMRMAMGRYGSRISALVKLFEPRKGNAEGSDRVPGDAAGRRYDRARIDAAAEERSDRHIGCHVRRYGLCEARVELGTRGRKGQTPIRIDCEVPIASPLDAVPRHLQIVTRRQLVNFLKYAPTIRNAEQIKIFGQRVTIDVAGYARIGQQPFHLGCEQ